MSREGPAARVEFTGDPRRDREAHRAYLRALRGRPDELAFQEDRRRRGLDSTLDPPPYCADCGAPVTVIGDLAPGEEPTCGECG